jgi:catalase
VQTNAVRRRVLAQHANVDAKLAGGVADRLGMEVPEPLPLAMKRPPTPEVQTSKALSLMARPGELGIKTRRVAVVVAEGVDATSAAAAYAALAEGGALPRFVAPKLGAVPGMGGRTLDAEITLETMPAVLFDAVVLADGPDAATTLANDGHAIEFVKDQFRHCKPILAIGAAATVLEAAGIHEGAPGVVRVGASESGAGVQAFTRLLAAHRVFERETDPPVI